MKKVLIIFLILTFTIGCDYTNKVENKSNKKDNLKTSNEITEKNKEPYIDINPIKLGLYTYTNSRTDRKLTTEYYTDWILNVDLCSLEVYYTTDDTIPSTNQKQLWKTYYDNYQNIDNYHIGYTIEFSTSENNISKTILNPADTIDIYDYIQIYLYDDINQDNSWYDHIDSNEYNNETTLTSIKLTGSTKTNLITSDISLTVFTYDINNNDEFNENNTYRGISKFTTIIKKN